MSQLTDFFKEDDERRRKRLEAAQGWITEKLGQVKTKAEVTVDQVKEYFTSGKVKEDLPKLPGKAMDTAQAFFKGGAAALPLPSPQEVGEKIKTRFPEFVSTVKQKATDLGFKPLEQPKTFEEMPFNEKAGFVSGAVTSQIGQFVGAGKIADALLGTAFTGAKMIDYSRRLGVPITEMLKAKKALGVSFKVIPDAWLRGAMQWGLAAAPGIIKAD